MIAALLYDLGYTPHPAIDFTPGVFAVSMLFVGWALFEDESLSVTTLSGDTLVDNLPDPVIALNDDCVIIDYNAAAASALGLRSQRPVPRHRPLPWYYENRTWRGALARGFESYAT